VMLAATRVERITARHVAGSVISLGGVFVLFLDRLDVASDQAIGVALIFGSVVVSAMYSIVMKRHGGAVNGVVATAVFLAVTAIVLGVVAIVAAEPLPWPPPTGPTAALLY